MIIKRYIPFILAALLQSCIYPYTPDLPEERSGRIVIEGDITVGDNCRFSARKMLPLSFHGYTDETFIDEAVFTVEHDSGISYSATQTGGVSSTSIDLSSAPTNGRYRLLVKVTDSTLVSEYATPWMEPTPAPLIGDLEETVFDSDQDRVLDYLALSINLSSDYPGGCYCWDYDELYYFHTILPPPEQEYRNGIIIDHSEDFSSWWQYSYCWKQASSKVTGIAIARSLEGGNLRSHKFLQLPLTAQQLDQNKYYIRFKAKSISEDKYRFLDALNRGSDGARSLLSPLPGEIFGNIRNTADTSTFALGYISANLVAKKILKVKTPGFKPTVYPSNFYYDPYFDPSVSFFEASKRAYGYGYYPYKNEDGKLWWVKQSCVDCRADGGTLEKPDGWTDD